MTRLTYRQRLTELRTIAKLRHWTPEEMMERLIEILLDEDQRRFREEAKREK